MATSNLISRTLGSINVESGSGTPDHTAPTGSMYTDYSTGRTYLRAASAWTLLTTSSFGGMYISNNASVTTIGASNTWVNLNGLTFTLKAANGVSLSSNTLQIESGRSGKYHCMATVTIKRNVADGIYEVGISKNSAVPASSSINGGTINATVLTDNIYISDYIDLADNDTVGLAIQSTNSTSSIIVQHATFVINRISD